MERENRHHCVICTLPTWILTLPPTLGPGNTFLDVTVLLVHRLPLPTVCRSLPSHRTGRFADENAKKRSDSRGGNAGLPLSPFPVPQNYPDRRLRPLYGSHCRPIAQCGSQTRTPRNAQTAASGTVVSASTLHSSSPKLSGSSPSPTVWQSLPSHRTVRFADENAKKRTDSERRSAALLIPPPPNYPDRRLRPLYSNHCRPIAQCGLHTRPPRNARTAASGTVVSASTLHSSSPTLRIVALAHRVAVTGAPSHSATRRHPRRGLDTWPRHETARGLQQCPLPPFPPPNPPNGSRIVQNARESRRARRGRRTRRRAACRGRRRRP
jgi:hypothetical protein